MANETGRQEASLRALFVFVAVVAYAVSPVFKYADTYSATTAAAVGGIGV